MSPGGGGTSAARLTCACVPCGRRLSIRFRQRVRHDQAGRHIDPVCGLGAAEFVSRSAPSLAGAVRDLVPGGVDAAFDAALPGLAAMDARRAGGPMRSSPARATVRCVASSWCRSTSGPTGRRPERYPGPPRGEGSRCGWRARTGSSRPTPRSSSPRRPCRLRCLLVLLHGVAPSRGPGLGLAGARVKNDDRHADGAKEQAEPPSRGRAPPHDPDTPAEQAHNDLDDDDQKQVRGSHPHPSPASDARGTLLACHADGRLITTLMTILNTLIRQPRRPPPRFRMHGARRRLPGLRQIPSACPATGTSQTPAMTRAALIGTVVPSADRAVQLRRSGVLVLGLPGRIAYALTRTPQVRPRHCCWNAVQDPVVIARRASRCVVSSSAGRADRGPEFRA
jgi:hypothetical protein